MTLATPAERFWAKVDRLGPDDCWLWLASCKPNGYGQFDHQLAHRFAYADVKGAIPAGLVIDHTCQQRRCVNPAHLDAVTQSENVRRGYAPSVIVASQKARAVRRTHCGNGHEMTPENTYVSPGQSWRQCRTCKSDWNKRRAESHAQQ